MASPRLASVRRFAGRLWGWLDASRRVALNLLFAAPDRRAGRACSCAAAPPALRDKTALVLALQGSIVEQRSGSLRDGALRQAARRSAAADAAARRAARARRRGQGRQDRARVVLMLDDFERRRPGHAARGGRGARALQGERQEGRGLGLGLRPAPVLPRRARRARSACIRWALVYLDGFGGYRNYYQRRARPLGVSANVIRVGTYKSAGEPFIANGPSPESLEADALALRRALGDLHRRRREGAQAAGRQRCAQASTSCRSASPRPAATPRKLALDAQAGRRAEDARRAARPDDRARRRRTTEHKTFRQVSFDDYLARLKPRAHGRRDRRRRRRGRDRRRQAPARHASAACRPPTLIRKARDDKDDQGHRAARRLARRQRLRLRAGAARARADARRRQAGRGVDGRRRGVGRLLDLDGVRRDHRRRRDDHRLDRRLRDAADRRQGARQARRPHRRRDAPPGCAAPTTRGGRSTRALPS